MKRTSLVLALALTCATALFLASPEHRMPNEDTAKHVGQEVAAEAHREAFTYVPMAPTSIAASLREHGEMAAR